MAWTQSDLTAMRDAMAKGIKRLTFADGRTTEFQNADQMLAVYTAAKTEVDLAERTAAGRPRARFARFSSGF